MTLQKVHDRLLEECRRLEQDHDAVLRMIEMFASNATEFYDKIGAKATKTRMMVMTIPHPLKLLRLTMRMGTTSLSLEFSPREPREPQNPTRRPLLLPREPLHSRPPSN
jgi:hypothetical protein